MSTEIGNRIKRMRLLKDLKQDDMAKQLAITPGAYAKIERGETDPSASRLLQIAKILKIDVSALLKDQPEKTHGTTGAGAVSRTEWELLSKHVVLLNKEIDELKSQISSLQKNTTKKK